MQKYAPDAKKAVPTEADLGEYRIADPEEFGRNMLRFMEESSKVMSGLIERLDSKTGAYAVRDTTETTRILTEVAQPWIAAPAKLVAAQGALFSSYMQLWSTTMRRAMGQEAPAVAEPEPGDNRFKDPDWTRNPYFDFWKQAYLITARWLEDMLDKTEGLDERTRHKAEFYLKQLVSALSPSNFPLTNPVVMRETFQSSGRNLVQGINNLAEDVERSGEMFKISQTDVSAFEVGRNVATAPGKVVFQNDIFQLIQYTPSTEQVFERPLLIVPPWINKFYILDLGAHKSFIRFAVSKGFTVFVVSWVNPDSRLAHKTFENYMTEGILTAADAVKRETGAEKCNVIGYCVGGTLLGTTLAYLAARGEEPFSSATFFAAQVDFSKGGDLKLFIDEDQLKMLEEMMSECGYLDAARMATVFNMLRPRDLIWNYVVNNYMLGKKPPAFDLLYWNQDSTRMPRANHMFYLREFYLENKLARGQMMIGNVKLDLKKVKIPIYTVCAKEDHIAPAQSVFIGSRLFGGPVTFVMSGSGHIAGIINPPADKMKYQYWVGDPKARSLEDWIKKAEEHPGSWWPNYAEWLAQYSGDKVDPRTPGARLGVIEDAPGSYVKTKG